MKRSSVRKFAVIFVRHKTDRVADRVRAAGAADAMHIIFRVHREIVIHDVRNAVHVNAARRDVRGHEHAHDAVLEIFQRPEPLVLRAVGMQRGRFDARLFQLPREAIGRVFHARENQHHVHRRIFQQMHEQCGLQMLRHLVNKLCHGLGGIGAAANLNQLWCVLKFMRERFNFLRQRGGEKQRLPFLGQRADDLADGRQKTHVQHAVGFVEHEILQRGKIGVAALHQIHQAAGAGDDQMRAGAERVDLRMFADATKNASDAEGQMFAVGFDVFLNLQSEFARGREHERAGAALAAIADDAGQPGEHRQREGRRFAGAGLRDADEVLARQNRAEWPRAGSA